MYGYVKLMGKATPRAVVRRLSTRQGDNEADASAIKGVTVVWVARNLDTNRHCVIGWFRNATVDAKWSVRPDAKAVAKDLAARFGSKIRRRDGEIHCFISCKRDDALLLPVPQRVIPVRVGERGWMANNNFVFYPDGGDNAAAFEGDHRAFKEDVLDYVSLDHDTLEHSSTVPLDELELPADEGKLKLLTHRVRERDRRLAQRAKSRFKRQNEGRLFCEVCRFDFGETYGKLGKKPSYFIEAHHVVPLEEGRRRNSPKDFMMLCSNCHRMVHRRMAKVGTITREETLAICSE